MLLSDPDRIRSYAIAIKEAIEDFVRHNERAPDVVDLGCGTGVLGILALQYGARTVVSIDTNESCVAATQASIDASKASNWTCSHAEDVLEGSTYDMLISEMLGTLAFGEQGLEAIEEYLPRLRAVAGGPYVIPQHATQTVSRYTLPRVEGENPWLSKGLTKFLRSQQSWIGTNSINLHPACLGLVSIGCPQVVYEADYTVCTARMTDAHFTGIGGDEILLFEWTARLWNNTALCNTVRGYQDLTIGNAVGRECAWGFAVTSPPASENVTVRVCEDAHDMLIITATDNDTWKATDISPAANVSFGTLLHPETGRIVEQKIRSVRAGQEVLVETVENAFLLRPIEETCRDAGLEEPWHQDDVHNSWTMLNPILRTGVPIEEPKEGGKLALAILLDAQAEVTSEAACRNNDERFLPEKSTKVQLLELMKSFGGDEVTTTIPENLTEGPLEWNAVELVTDMTQIGLEPLLQDAMTSSLQAPLEALCGYAALTRHGMLGNECMPGILTQALPVLVRPRNRKRKQTASRNVISMQLASPIPWKNDTRRVKDVETKELRALVSKLCVVGAAVKCA